MRKHSTWLWGIIILGTVVSFVWWGANPGSRSGGYSAGSFGRINGKVVTEDAYLAARNEARIRYFMRNGEWPTAEAKRQGFDLQEETYKLLLLIQELEKRDMYAGPEAKAKLVAAMLNPLRKQGIASLAAFETHVLKPQGLSLVDFDHYIEHEITLQQLIAVEGMAGELISPQQAESIYRRENQEISAQAVFFSASNYLSSVTVQPDALTNFYTRYMGNYRIPERIQLSYVAFPITNHLAKVDDQTLARFLGVKYPNLASLPSLADQIEAIYRQRGTNFYNDVTPEVAKQEIREEVHHDYATRQTYMEAAAFADKVMSLNPVQPSNLNRVAQEENLTVEVTKPFSRNGQPEGLDVPSAFTDTAFKLRMDEPFASPIIADDYVYVVALKDRLPSENPPLAQVMDKVTVDYRRFEATLLAREAGTNFVNQLTNSLAAGKSFADVCAAANVKPQLLPPIARSTRSAPEIEDHAPLSYFKQVAFATPVGHASDFTLSGQGGFVVYVQSELPLDEAKMKEEMPQFLTYVRRSLEQEAFNRWFSKAVQTGLRETPLAKAQPPEVSAEQ